MRVGVETAGGKGHLYTRSCTMGVGVKTVGSGDT